MEIIYCDNCKKDMTNGRIAVTWKISVEHSHINTPPEHFCGFRCLTRWVYKKDVEAHKNENSN